jgi:hypothetical protein
MNNEPALSRNRFFPSALRAFFCLVVLASCGGQFSPAQTLPDSGVIPGWTAVGQTQTFDKKNIFELMDGQAEYYFRYGFELVAVRSYQDSRAVRLEAEVWRLAIPTDAYGLFSANDEGHPILIGSAVDANLEDGSKLVLWQDRYFVVLRALDTVQNADLVAFGESISGALPTGGQAPELIGRLPAEGKIERSEIFFHEEVTIQNELWLGGKNLLGLSPETDVVLAKYVIGGETELLLLVEYPDPSMAAVAHFALESSNLEGMQGSFANGKVLAAAFGNGPKADVENLLARALIAWMP